jgi:hypothetical protein
MVKKATASKKQMAMVKNQNGGFIVPLLAALAPTLIEGAVKLFSGKGISKRSQRRM